MIDNIEPRREIARALGSALDDLVRDRMEGLIEEPDITSRVGQRLEERFDGKDLHGYRIRVITETITSHGTKSLEKPLGTDLYFAISVEDERGDLRTKGVLVQAKRRENLNWPILEEQCRRMNMVTKKGAVVWVYPKFEAGRVHINKDQYFADVPEVAWSFRIGGYQPAQKWLKDRRGRSLSWDDIGRYQKIIKILVKTDRIMKEIELPLD